MNNGYLEVISLIERLHRHFLEVVKLELDGLGIYDINNVQGMMLFNVGDAEMTAHTRAIDGTSTRWWSGLLANGCTCGAPSITRARFSTCCFSAGATSGRQSG